MPFTLLVLFLVLVVVAVLYRQYERAQQKIRLGDAENYPGGEAGYIFFALSEAVFATVLAVYLFAAVITFFYVQNECRTRNPNSTFVEHVINAATFPLWAYGEGLDCN